MRHALKCGATHMTSLATDKICAGFPAADNAEAVAFDEHLGGARPRVVVGGGHKPVGSCAPHHKQVTRANLTERPILHEEITSFADRSHDVSAHSMPRWGVLRLIITRRIGKTHRTPHQVR